MSLDRAWNTLVQMTLLGGVVWLFLVTGLWLLRKAAAAHRHLLLALLMNALLIFPFLSWFLPQWGIRWYLQCCPPSEVSVRRAPPSNNPSEMQGTSFASPSQRETSASSRRLPLPATSFSMQARTPDPVVRAVIPAHPALVVRSQHPEIPIWHLVAFRKFLLATWLLGCAVSLLHLFAGLARTWRLKSSEISTSHLIAPLITQVQTEMGFRHPIRVRQGIADATIAGPLTWGCLRPILLLPMPLTTWSPERLRMILLHEIAHMQRADWLFQLLAQLARSLYWFHPGVWWAVRRLQAESEIACDDMVLLAGVAPTDYATTLVEVIRTMNRSKTSSLSSSSALSMARPPLEARLRAMLTPHSHRRPSRAVILLASSATLLSVIPLAALHVGADPVETTPRVLPIPRTAHTVAALSLSPLLGHSATVQRPASLQTITTSASSPQRSVQTQDENRRLRQRLDELQQLLFQNMHENEILRHQLAAFQQLQTANKARTMEKTAKATRAKLEAIKAMENASRHSQIASLKDALQSLNQQKVELADRYSRLEQLLRVGNISQEEVNNARAELESNELKINALANKIADLTNRRHIPAREQTRRDLVMQLKLLQVLLREKQDVVTSIKAHYNSGDVSQKELVNAEQIVANIQAHIDEVQRKLQQTDPMR